jgi:hypothetical protein
MCYTILYTLSISWKLKKPSKCKNEYGVSDSFINISILTKYGDLKINRRGQGQGGEMAQTMYAHMNK